MFFNNAFARPGMFASQRSNYRVPNAQPQPAPPPQRLPSSYLPQSYQTFSVQPGAEGTVMGRTLSPAEREATYSNNMGMESPRPSVGIGDFMRRQGAGQAIAAPPMASNTMGMEQPLLYQPPQMMGIMSLLSGLFGDNFGQPPVQNRAIGETPRPDFNMVDNNMGMSNFRDRPKASPPSAPVSPPTRVTNMFGSQRGISGFGQPFMGGAPGGKGGAKGGGMFGQPSYGMQARYSSPFQGFF
jgi:hypothetical protein